MITRKYNYSIKLYDFSNKEIMTLFDIKPLFENQKIICFTNKSVSKIYICLDYVKNPGLGYSQSRFFLLSKLKIDKNLDLLNVFNVISRLQHKENFVHSEYKFHLDYYSKFLSKLNRIKNAK
jgi:hypothetical protein